MEAIANRLEAIAARSKKLLVARTLLSTGSLDVMPLLSLTRALQSLSCLFSTVTWEPMQGNTCDDSHIFLLQLHVPFHVNQYRMISNQNDVGRHFRGPEWSIWPPRDTLFWCPHTPPLVSFWFCSPCAFVLRASLHPVLGGFSISQPRGQPFFLSCF